MATIENRLYEIIAESLSVNVSDIKSDSSFIDDLDADSLDVVEMIMADALAFLEKKGITD